MAQVLRTDTITNNLANVDTTGFKKELAAFSVNFPWDIKRINDQVVVTPRGRVDPRPPVGILNNGVLYDETYVDLSQGPILTTGNPLDFALEGDGYFTVQTPGGVLYTRDGSFTRNALGELVTQEGYRVLGVDGPIVIGEGDVSVMRGGEVMANGEQVGVLRIENFSRRSLMKVGHNFYQATGSALPTTTTVHQGALEGSNAEAVRDLVSLISAFRAYELNQRMVQVQDQTLDRAVNEVGRSGGR